MNGGKLPAHVSFDYRPDETDFKRGKKASNSWSKVEDSGNEKTPADNNSTDGIVD